MDSISMSILHQLTENFKKEWAQKCWISSNPVILKKGQDKTGILL